MLVNETYFEIKVTHTILMKNIYLAFSWVENTTFVFELLYAIFPLLPFTADW